MIKETVLIADDEHTIRYAAKNALSNPNRKVFEASNGMEAIEIIKKNNIQVAVLDIKMPKMNGLEALTEIKKISPNTFIIMMSAYGDISRITEAMKHGAYDFLSKPFNHINDLISIVNKAFKAYELLIKNKNTSSKKEKISKNFSIIGKSPKMQEIYKLIGKIASSNVTVLVTGESGSGKELIAKAIHNSSSRSSNSFLAVNCTAIPETLIESEFFGHEKGSFTGAVNTKIGKFEMADSGTLFLDEIGDMSPDIQAKLLRVLQEREIVRVGGNRTIKIDVRIIAATNRNLEENIINGKFREDLYHRLKVVSIHIPALRERKEDIPPLVEYFIKTLNNELNTNVKSVSPEVMDIFMAYSWPGNIRELRNSLESSIAIHQETTIQADHLPKEIVEKVKELNINNIEKKETIEKPIIIPENIITNESNEIKDKFLQYFTLFVKDHISRSKYDNKAVYSDIISIVEKVIIKEALEHFDGNQVKTAKFLNINRNTLRSKIEKHQL